MKAKSKSQVVPLCETGGQNMEVSNWSFFIRHANQTGYPETTIATDYNKRS